MTEPVAKPPTTVLAIEMTVGAASVPHPCKQSNIAAAVAAAIGFLMTVILGPPFCSLNTKPLQTAPFSPV
jgi:hypothetical protein